MLDSENRAGPRQLQLILVTLFILLLALSAGHSWAQENGWPTPTYDESSATEAKEQLGDILSRPAYQWETDPVNVEPSLWERIRDRLLEILFNLLPESAGAANGIVYLLALLGAVILAVVLAFVARTFLRNLAADSTTVGEMDDATAVSAADAHQQAEQLSAVGDYRAAVRYLYLSALLALDEHGHLRYDRSRTNREYLSTVSGRPALAESLRQVVDIFDAVWYGFKPLDAATYAAYAAQVNQLRRLA